MSIIDEIKNTINIVDVFRAFDVALPAHEKTFSVRCVFPNHEDAHPSLTLYPKANRAWCHGCMRGGDVLDITQVFLDCGLQDAIAFWKHRLGIKNNGITQLDLGRMKKAQELNALKKIAKDQTYIYERFIGPCPADGETLTYWNRVYFELDQLEYQHSNMTSREAVLGYLADLHDWFRWAIN